MKDEALKLALEALEEACELIGPAWAWRNEKGKPSITAIKQALAAPVQEPVAFKIYKPTPPRGAIPDVRDAELPWVYDQDPSSGNVASMWVTPVKATPPAAQQQWVGLTRQDIEIAFDDTQEGGGFDDFARAIEAKLKEKNT